MRNILFAMTLLFVATLGVEAVTLVSAPLTTESNQKVVCAVQNLTEVRVDVLIEVKSFTGVILHSQGFSVNDGVAGDVTGAAPGDNAYCVFHFEGKKKDVRGYAKLFDVNTNEMLLVIEAR